MNRFIKTSIIYSAILAGTTAYATNPSVDYLQKQYGISQSDAEKRIDLQGEIIELSEKLNQSNDPNYADMYIQHEPVYKIVLLFADNKERLEFIRSLDPKLQRWVQVKQAKRSRDTYNEELEKINNNLRKTDILYTVEYDLPSQKYIVTIEDKGQTQFIRKAMSNMGFQGDFSIVVGSIPKVETVTGESSGDRIYGGDQVWTESTNASNKVDYLYCTLGYGITYKSGNTLREGVVTAGHCGSPMYLNISGRIVKLSSPIVRKPSKKEDGVSDKYDYQIWDTMGLGVDNRIKYKDINGIPEFPSTGVMKLTSVVNFYNQKVGMIACKSGASTGITCGKITNGNATRDGISGWIQVGNSSQSNISSGGDSGGPWFLYPGTSDNISGLGIHSAGNDNPDIAIYMPIDYIDDHISSVNTAKTTD